MYIIYCFKNKIVVFISKSTIDKTKESRISAYIWLFIIFYLHIHKHDK